MQLQQHAVVQQQLRFEGILAPGCCPWHAAFCTALLLHAFGLHCGGLGGACWQTMADNGFQANHSRMENVQLENVQLGNFNVKVVTNGCYPMA